MPARRESVRATVRNAWDTVVALPQETLDAIAVIVEHANREGDYTGMDEDGGSFLEESVSETLGSLASAFRNMKNIHDPGNVLDPF